MYGSFLQYLQQLTFRFYHHYYQHRRHHLHHHYNRHFRESERYPHHLVYV